MIVMGAATGSRAPGKRGWIVTDIPDVTDQTFDAQVLKPDIAVLVEMWAEWCIPCAALSKVVQDLAEEYAGALRVVRMDVDRNSQTAVKYELQNVPALVLFKNGLEVTRLSGAFTKQELNAKLLPFLDL